MKNQEIIVVEKGTIMEKIIIQKRAGNVWCSYIESTVNIINGYPDIEEVYIIMRKNGLKPNNHIKHYDRFDTYQTNLYEVRMGINSCWIVSCD